MNENEKNNVTKKQKDGKWGILVIIAIVIIVIVAVAFNLTKNNSSDDNTNEAEEENTATSYVETLDGGIKVNTSSALNETRKLDGLTISNIQLTVKDGMTTFLADVTNNTQQATEIKHVTITLIKKDGSELVSVNGIIAALDVGETFQLNVALTSDYVNAYDFVITSE